VQTSLRQSFGIVWRVIGAIVLREILTRFGRRNLGFLWLFIEPIVFTALISAVWSLMRDVAGYHGISVVAFAITGYSSILLWRNMANRCSKAIEGNTALLYHRNVKVLDIFTARILLELVAATTSFVVLSLVLSLLKVIEPPHDMLTVVGGWLLLAWIGTGLAGLLGAVCAQFSLAEKLWRPMSYLLMPVSGTFFMVDWLPPKSQEIVLWIPMVHGVEILRGGYFGPQVNVHYELGYVVPFCMGMTLLALAWIRVVSRRLLPQ
jgi:capsular polysaccharide transport system permease protein